MLLADDIIERYEAAIADGHWQEVAIDDFVPSRESPFYWTTLVELLRIRMEHQITSQDFHGVERCVAEFPELLDQPELLGQVAFEEYRLLLAHDVTVQPQDYASKWRIDVSNWSGSPDEYQLTEEDWQAALKQNATALATGGDAGAVELGTSIRKRSPKGRAVLACGQVFGPFRILAELGSGALASVYLAQQLDLSERLVVLKVCSVPTAEPQKIAQIEHPNIVQILSLHDVAGFQVLCMPYVGATTFADLVAVHSKSYQNAEAASRSSILFSTTISMRQREVQTLIEGVQLQAAASPYPIQSIQLHAHNKIALSERWKRVSYEQAVCELLYQAARGLEHAHQQGIVHSDLKPANILLGDDGIARLVDFNVSQSAFKSPDRSLLGGTLPYLAPEHLCSLKENVWHAGPASDLYSLGVIAYQLLSGSLPHEVPSGKLDEVLQEFVRRRLSTAVNTNVLRASPDLRSIVGKMLASDQNERYASASQLCEDLRRHIDNRPLVFARNSSPVQRVRKWLRRHPRIGSASTVGTVAFACVALITAATWSERVRMRSRIASDRIAMFEKEAPQVFVAAASRQAFPELQDSLAEQVAELLTKLDDGDVQLTWKHTSTEQRKRFASQLWSLGVMLERETLESSFTRKSKVPPEALVRTEGKSTHHMLQQSAQRFKSIAESVDDSVAAEVDSVNESELQVDSALGEIAAALKAYLVRDQVTAKQLLQSQLAKDPEQPAAWILLGHCYVSRQEFLLADQAYSNSIARLPNHWQSWYFRGLSNLQHAKASGRAELYQQAAECFTQALALRASLNEAIYNRAICYEHLRKPSEAIADASRLVSTPGFKILANLFCARVYQSMERKEQAEACLAEAYREQADTATEFIELGNSRLMTDPKQALADLLRANSMHRGNVTVLQNLAYLSMEVLRDEEVALQSTSDWILAAPKSAAARASRAVLHARYLRSKEAIEDAVAAESLSPDAREFAQIASVYALVASTAQEANESREYRDKAFQHLARALQLDWRIALEVKQDPDLLKLRDDSRFGQYIKSAGALYQLPNMTDDSSAKSK